MTPPARFPVRRLLLLGVALIAFEPFVQAIQTEAPSTPAAKVRSPQITELSGIAKSGRFLDTYWVHNDSGDSARIFAIRSDGSSVGSEAGISIAGARNVDWEDITREGRNLIVSDMGNNRNRRRDLGVYVVPEPDPTKVTETAPATRIPIAYPDQTSFPPTGAYEFDCEALFSLRGKLYFISKARLNSVFPGTSAKLYRLDSRDPSRTNVLKLADRAELGGWVTSASVSPDGKRLAVLTHLPEQAVWLFDTKAKGDHFLSKGKARKLALAGLRQAEAICWDDNRTLRIGNEEGELFRFDASAAVRVR
jgi:hypothetical protein